MRSLPILLALVFFATACTTVAKHSVATNAPAPARPIDYRFAVDTPNGSPVDVLIYNQMVAKQGYEHYCGSNQCDKLPELVSGYAPVYPSELIASGITGQTTIVFIIDENGDVADARVESTTRAEFSDASLSAIRTWKFKPATLKGQPIRMSSRQAFPFDLR